jgi:GntR family transcriptional regulator
MTDADWTSTSDPYLVPQKGDAWATEAASRGHTGTQKLLEVATVDPDPEVRRALGLTWQERAVLRRRLIVLDGQPVEVTSSYYPERLAAGTALAEDRKIRGGAVAVLAEIGHAPATVTEQVSADLPTHEEQKTLSVGPGAPLVILKRLSRDTAGTPVAFEVMHMVAQRVTPLTYQKRIAA